MSYDKLVLEIELAEFNADGIEEDIAVANLYCGHPVDAVSLLDVIIEEYMEESVTVTILDIPAEKSGDRPTLHAQHGRIVGARIKRV